jgi:hypothetical protein
LKNRSVVVLGVVGALLAIQSIMWEYGRMRPDYPFIVEPWSLRGYETVHGSIAVAAGVLALISVLAVAWRGSERVMNGVAITVVMAVGATAIALIFGGDDYTMTPGFPIIALLTVVIGTVLYRVFLSVARDTRFATSFWWRQLVLVVLVVGTALVVNALIGGKRISWPQWVLIGIVFILLAALSISPEPRELAANRMLMFSSAIGAMALALSAGAVRSGLLDLQRDAGGVPALYKDSQVTSGHLMAVLGMGLVFVASVALWARRRDAILTAQRAQRQREAAEASAAEIEAAMRQAELIR